MGKLRFWMGLLLAGGVALAHAQGNPAAGKEKAMVCAGCHGEDGNSSAPIFPKIAGQHAAYIAKQLHDFKSQKRGDPTMGALAEPLTGQDIDDLAAYYSQQKITIEKTEANALGETIYRTGNLKTGVPACTGCHGFGGNGNPGAVFPQLNGQYAAYVEKTLRDFKAGERGNDMNGMMRALAARMNEAEIKAVADYISSLQ
ncbi:Cytochrome c553 [Methylomagnum ishizawai]|uniref:Cytochrome c553 n=2 Tax=Methylomagnum ishizawai TaxID=1760988 RepID=A0A1Y6CZ21_9GAMM|nr:Cytochrome c553 [Methylomagnum ishizawai]